MSWRKPSYNSAVKNIFLFISCAFFLISCKPKIETYVYEIPVLRASSIYTLDSVDFYLQKYSDTNHEIANSYYQKSLTTERTNPAKAEFYIKRAITLDPCKKYYNALAEFNYRHKNYKDMFSAYQFLNQEMQDTVRDPFHFEQKKDPDLILNRLVADILADSGILVNYLDEDVDQDAKDMHITLAELKDKLLSDKRLHLDPNSEKYKNILLNFLTYKEILAYLDEPNTLKYFYSTIQDTSCTFQIGKKEVQLFDYHNFNGSNYRGMGPDDMLISDFFDRYTFEKRRDTTWNGSYNFNHRVKLNDSITLVIYAVDHSQPACPRDVREIYHQLVVYNGKGQIITHDTVAWQKGEKLATLEFDHNKFWITYYKRNWEKPYKSDDFDNNVTSIEQTDRKGFQIGPDGKITEMAAAPATP